MTDFVKRLTDIFVSLIGLCLLWPLLVFLGVIIRLTSPGPAIFKQCRIGRDARPFTLYKFRSMYVNSPHLPTHEMSIDALTPVGRIIRKTKIDELPQLYNVIRGDMSLVGPRPCLPSQTHLIYERTLTGAFKVRPGITGLAQVFGVDMSEGKRLSKIDGYYAKKRSFCGDIAILFRTFC